MFFTKDLNTKMAEIRKYIPVSAAITASSAFAPS